MMHARRLKLPVLLGCLSMFAAVVPAARADVAAAVQAFDAGNRHYAVGNYRSAIDSYRQALDEGYASAPLLYNLGNAHFRLDELGEAIRSYERARLLEPDDPQVAHNLSIAHGQTVDQFSRLPTPYWRRAWLAVVRYVGPWPLFAVGLTLWVLGAAAAIRRTLTGSPSAWLRRALTVSLLAGGILLVAAFTASAERDRSRRGVVVAEEVDLLTEPSATAETEITVHEGVVVNLLRRRPNWTFVQLPNGTRGWAPEGAIGDISL